MLLNNRRKKGDHQKKLKNQKVKVEVKALVKINKNQ